MIESPLLPDWYVNTMSGIAEKGDRVMVSQIGGSTLTGVLVDWRITSDAKPLWFVLDVNGMAAIVPWDSVLTIVRKDVR